MYQKTLQNFILLLILLFIFYSCSSSESTVVVVEDSPTTLEAAQQDSVNEQFTQLNIGLIDSVTNFDPLFAENLSTQRTLTLIYDGLFTLDRQGNPIPSIASSVEISEDSLEYVFQLNQNKFFHNSAIFNSGVGRRVNATDIKNVFERTAKISVPNKAAELLMGVRGFENYYLEQRSVYDPDQRVLEDVAGIQVIDRQTLGIVLKEKDPQFLTKLASPYLLIYPRESTRDNRSTLSDHPIGTGPYQFNTVESSDQIVLIRRENSDGRNLPTINRINLQMFENESRLYQEFSSSQTDWIPEIGPEISSQILDGNGQLQSSYQENFNLSQNNATRISAFYLNDQSDVNQEWLINRLAYLTTEDFSTRADVLLNVDDFEIIDTAQPLERYYASYTEDALSRKFLAELNNIIFAPNSSLVMFDIRIPTRQTSIYTSNSSSLHNSLRSINNNYFLRANTQILGIHKNRVSGIEPTNVPWLLHIDQIGVQNSLTSAE